MSRSSAWCFHAIPIEEEGCGEGQRTPKYRERAADGMATDKSQAYSSGPSHGAS